MTFISSSWNSMHSRSTCITVRLQQFHPFRQLNSRRISQFHKKNLSPLQQLFFKELKKQSGILKALISKNVSIKKMYDGFNTNPSKRNLGHYKYLLTSDRNKYDKNIIHFKASMLELRNTLINDSISIRVPLTRWTTSEVIMIEKEKKIQELIG